jgi:DNA topoisomerase IB
MKVPRHPPSSIRHLSSDPIAAAHAAGLRYSTDDKPGIMRRRAGRGWRYVHPDGSPVSKRPNCGASAPS